MATHQGHCFCGAVEIEVNGAPEAMPLGSTIGTSFGGTDPST